jgi:hypothetical protein
MSWQAALARALRDLRREENRIVRELQNAKTRLTRLTAIVGGGAASGRQPTTRNLSAKGRAAIVRAAKKRWVRYRAERRA